MPFKPGHKNVGGRPKGVKNRNTLAIEEKAAELGIDPFEVLLNFVKGDWAALGYPARTETRIGKGGESYEVELITPDHRLRAAGEACQYLYPKRKAIEHSTDNQSGFVITVKDFTTLEESK